MTRFRPCIDLHEGRVKQIVGSSLSADGSQPRTNFVSDRDASWFAELYSNDGLKGGHVIMLGAGNESAAASALRSYPSGLQIGGGINADNAEKWLEAGASHVIVTSYLFDGLGRFLEDRLRLLSERVGRFRLVVDLSCKRTGDGWTVAMNRWQTVTNLRVDEESIRHLSSYCDELLVHAGEVEGKCEGVDSELVGCLSNWSPIPVTYAGGARHLNDLQLIDRISLGKVDVTVGSALDIFGGKGLLYSDCVSFNHRLES